jgi:hypothetical protein
VIDLAILYLLESLNRHCEPPGRANARPMTGSAKQSRSVYRLPDCFVALLLAMARNKFARRCVDMVHRQIVRPRRRARRNRRKIHFLAPAIEPRDEWNDLGAHERPSHTAIAIRPANASDIRYAVMLASLFGHELNVRHDAFNAIISGANPIPPGAIRMADRRWPGPRRAWTLPTPRAGAFARAGY